MSSLCSRIHTDFLKDINKIDLFSRAPLDHRNYLAYVFKLKKEYGSVMNFVVKERLQWIDLTPKDASPFADLSISDTSSNNCNIY